MSDIFNPPADQPNPPADVTLDVLVGEDKKYKTVDELAKAYVHADSHLSELRRDLAQIKAERDVLANQSVTPPQAKPEETPSPPAPSQTPAPNGNEDWRSRIREELKAVTEEEKYALNVEAAGLQMIKVYGDSSKASEAVAKRAQELGVSADWLRDAAARSPSAFYATMGIQPDAPATNKETPHPKNEFRPPSGGPTGERTYAHYEAIRRENKGLYYSVAVQKEMQEQARKLGSAFYA